MKSVGQEKQAWIQLEAIKLNLDKKDARMELNFNQLINVKIK